MAIALRQNRVGHVENRIGGPIVLLERDRFGSPDDVGELVQVVHRRCAEAVDRLRVIAHHGDGTRVAERPNDVGLQRVGVLVFVDEDVVEPRAHRGSNRWRDAQCSPVQQQVVEVENPLSPLAGDVLPQHDLERLDVLDAPREMILDDGGELLLAVDHARVHRRDGVGTWKTTDLGELVQLGPHEPDQVGGVAGIEHRERWRQADRLGVGPQQAIGDRVKRPAPDLARPASVGHGGDAVEHLGCSATGEGEQQDPVRICTGLDQRRDPGGERLGLAGSGARNDEQMAAIVLDRGPLGGVERLEPGRVHLGGIHEHAFETTVARW